MLRFGFVTGGLVCGLLCGLPVLQAQDAAAEVQEKDVETQDIQKQVSELIVKLGDPQFAERERATRQLAQIGLPAKQQLLTSLKKSPDAEVRLRCRRVLAVVLDIESRQQLQAFIADRDGSEGRSLPGWEKFQEVVGEGAVERQLFVEMHQQEPTLMEVAQQAPAEVREALEVRCEQLRRQLGGRYGNTRPLPLGSIAAVLFLSAVSDGQASEQLASSLYAFCYQQSFRTEISSGSRAETLKRLLGVWIQTTANTTRAQQGIYLARQYKVQEGVPLAVSLLKQNDSPVHIRLQAIQAIAELGGEAQVKVLESQLDDTTQCSISTHNGVKIITQVRDVALAALITVTEQKLADYGFFEQPDTGRAVFRTPTLGFPDDKQRDKALAKWREWAKEHRGEEK